MIDLTNGRESRLSRRPEAVRWVVLGAMGGKSRSDFTTGGFAVTNLIPGFAIRML